ncbi:hypothetical protein CPB86DRAFT_792129 [Serendipita vermifera]|nr:hypothetical protein CPB86DRAFT_792129 [Serendipita vermifera]
MGREFSIPKHPKKIRKNNIEGLTQCYKSLIIALDKYVTGVHKGAQNYEKNKEKSG